MRYYCQIVTLFKALKKYWTDRRPSTSRKNGVFVQTLVNNTYGMLQAIGQDEQGRLKIKLERMPTGVDGLKPDSPFVRISEQLPLPDDIPYHSIIGNNEAGDVPGGTDGIVPYTSSHLDDAVSEKIVRSGHSAHNHPLAIQEVRRILHEHLDAVNKANAL